MLWILVLSGIVLWLLANYWLKPLYFRNRFYWTGGLMVVLFIASFFFPALLDPAKIIFLAWVVLIFSDAFFLFLIKERPVARRVIADRLSNGDRNLVTLEIKNNYPFTVHIQIIDELPEQFQARDHVFKKTFRAREEKKIRYLLRPVERGEYHFGNIILYVSTGLCLMNRRFDIPASRVIPVYPSFFQMRKFELLATEAQTSETGSKNIRKLGLSLEFEHVKEYTRGDDIRLINWKATARKGSLMINNYLDERSQQVYCIIDKGRLMKMPFDKLSLLDYAINSSLVMCNVCLHRHDRFGLITFSDKPGTLLPADKQPSQLQNVLQVLYNQATEFLESDFEILYRQVRAKIRHRSLLILFTNFESFSGMQRQLPYLQMLAKHHLLLVVFFENTELKQLTFQNARTAEDVYIKTVAEKFMHEKRMIVKELQNHGILSILTPPQNLTVNTVNKYLELKARQAI